jgi:hypothetical protein
VHAVAAVVADAIAGKIVTDVSVVVNVGVIDVGNVHLTDIGHAAVVEEIAIVPVTAGEADAEIAETVIDTAVETDVRRPVAFMPNEILVVVGPKPWCPQ